MSLLVCHYGQMQSYDFWINFASFRNADFSSKIFFFANGKTSLDSSIQGCDDRLKTLSNIGCSDLRVFRLGYSLAMQV